MNKLLQVLSIALLLSFSAQAEEGLFPEDIIEAHLSGNSVITSEEFAAREGVTLEELLKIKELDASIEHIEKKVSTIKALYNKVCEGIPKNISVEMFPYFIKEYAAAQNKEDFLNDFKICIFMLKVFGEVLKKEV